MRYATIAKSVYLGSSLSGNTKRRMDLPPVDLYDVARKRRPGSRGPSYGVGRIRGGGRGGVRGGGFGE